MPRSIQSLQSPQQQPNNSPIVPSEYVKQLHDSPLGVDEPYPPDFQFKSVNSRPYCSSLPKNEDPWHTCYKKVQLLDHETCQGWKDEIDTMLIFAGLFSATVTAFVVESYKDLSEPASETLARLQLQQFLKGAGETTISREAVEFFVEPPMIWINVFWFASLTLSMSAALVGILCKQWIREYQRYENLTPKEAFSVREMRYKGLHGWHVPRIISSLPLLVESALVLFFLGLLISLWTIEHTVASVASVIIGATLVFLTVTSLLPGIQCVMSVFTTKCPYKSPQSWPFMLFSISGLSSWSWIQYDQLHGVDRKMDMLSALKRFYGTFHGDVEAVRNLYVCLEDLGKVGPLFVDSLGETDVPRRSTIRIMTPDIPSVPPYLEKEIALASFSGRLVNRDPCMFNRHAEHIVRLLQDQLLDNPNLRTLTLESLADGINAAEGLSSPIEWDDGVASELIATVSSLLIKDQLNDSSVLVCCKILASLSTYHNRRPGALSQSPYTLLEDLGHWVAQSKSTRRFYYSITAFRQLLLQGSLNPGRADDVEQIRSFVRALRDLGPDEPDPDGYNIYDDILEFCTTFGVTPRSYKGGAGGLPTDKITSGPISSITRYLSLGAESRSSTLR